MIEAVKHDTQKRAQTSQIYSRSAGSEFDLHSDLCVCVDFSAHRVALHI